MKYELAASPINWRNDDVPEIGGHITVDDCLTEASMIGFSGIEMGASFPKETDLLKKKLDKYKLRLATGWYDMGLLGRSYKEEIVAMRSHYELLSALGCRLMVVAETIGTTVHNRKDKKLSERHRMNEDEWRIFLNRLEDLARYMNDQGMSLSYHPHIGTVIETQEEMDKLMNETQEVNLLYDTGHIYYAGGDPQQVFMDYFSRINHIHTKDVRMDVVKRVYEEDLSFIDGVLAGTFTVPSDGDIDFAPIAKRVRSSDYEGWLVLEAEQDPIKAPPAEYAAKGYKHIEELLNG